MQSRIRHCQNIRIRASQVILPIIFDQVDILRADDPRVTRQHFAVLFVIIATQKVLRKFLVAVSEQVSAMVVVYEDSLV